MVKQTIEPYFRSKDFTLKGLEARHIQQFYCEKLRTVKPNSVIHYHAVIHQALKYAMKTDLVPQNVAMKVDGPKKNDFQPVFLDAQNSLQYALPIRKTLLNSVLKVPYLFLSLLPHNQKSVCCNTSCNLSVCALFK